MKTICLLLICITAVSHPSTAAEREFTFRIDPEDPVTGKMARRDYSQCEAIPNTPTSYVFRKVQKAIPYTRDRAFWGRWAGSGCAGGTPVDEMDEIFRRHDIVYGEARSLRTMKWADAACVEALQKLDTAGMSPEGIAFLKRSSSFFSDRRFTLVGKPVSAWFLTCEEKDCPFQCEDDVREVFGLSKTGAAVPAGTEKTGKYTQMKILTKKVGARIASTTRRPVLKVRGWCKNVRDSVRGD